jgi:hypothetical protein
VQKLHVGGVRGGPTLDVTDQMTVHVNSLPGFLNLIAPKQLDGAVKLREETLNFDWTAASSQLH